MALPIVTFKSAPAVSPRKLAASSVARQSTSASGTIAKQFNMKMTVSFHPNSGATIPIGTKTSSRMFQFFARYLQVEKNADLEPTGR